MQHSWKLYPAWRRQLLKRVVVWFSCGATSAVAAKLSLATYRGKFPVRIVYCDTGSEDQDNERFLRDCEKWFDHEVTILKNEKYKDTWDLWRKRRYLVGPSGALCTTELKKVLRHRFIQVFGYDAGEERRASRFRQNNPEVFLDTPLIDRGLTKGDCLALLREAGIEPPRVYALLSHANCIPCVKGGIGYWNTIRKHYPAQFERMAKLERELNVAICRVVRNGRKVKVFLDELDPEAGRYEDEPAIDCGLSCGQAMEEIRDDDQCES